MHGIAEPSGDGLRLGHDRGLFGSAPERPQAPGLRAESADARGRMGVGARQAERLVDPVHRVRVAVSHDPVAAERRRQRERAFGAWPARSPSRAPRGGCRYRRRAWRDAPCGAGPQSAAIGAVALGEREEVAVVALADGVAVGGGGEALAGVGADRLQHPQPGGRVRVLAAHEQALGDEPVERVEAGAGDRLGRLDGGAAGEHREAREARLLVVAEQRVAPVDRRAQRLLAGGRVAGAGAERGERGVQALGDLAGREQPAAGGRQLDRERQPVDAPADLRDRGRVAVAERRSPGSCARARSQNSATASTPASVAGLVVGARAARAATRGSAARPAARAARGSWRAPSARDRRPAGRR